MIHHTSRFASPVIAALLLLGGPGSVWAGENEVLAPNNLVLIRSVYQGTANTVTVNQVLPPNCVAGTVQVPLLGGGTTGVKVSCGKATYDGTYPYVFFNASSDGNFGVSSPIYIDQLTPGGATISTVSVDPTQIVTSFSSKSELAVHKSLDGKSITFTGYVGGPGYVTGPNQLDISNSNTPGVIDLTNPDPLQYYRSVAEVDAFGKLTVTNSNAYSGDNSRGAIKADSSSYYMAGNNNNGGLSKTQLTATQDGVNLVNSTGIEFLVPGQAAPLPPNIAMVGNYQVPGDKPGKDTNFRGLAIHNNTLYFTKGSGSNGVNTVFQVNPGTLPTPANTGGLANLRNLPITIVPGFPTFSVSNPWGLWFANDTTVYVADEGDGTVASVLTDMYSGLQKWVFDGSQWSLKYVLRNGLNLGVSYSVANGPNGEVYPAAYNPVPAGLRHLTGRVNTDGTVSLWATTSTISASGDPGSDPNQLVYIIDKLSATTLPADETFTVLKTAGYGEVLRGIDFAPGTISGFPSSGSTCNGVYSGDFTGNITVVAGQECVFTGGSIKGNVQVNGGTLSLSNTTLSGNLATSGGSLSVGPSATLGGNVSITNMTGAANQVCQSTISGNLSVRDNSAVVMIGSTTPVCGGNLVGKNVTVENNSGAVSVFDNILGHSLACTVNSSITGGENAAPVKNGQCSAF